MHGVDPFPLFQMRTEVTALNPDLKATPRLACIRIDPAPVIRIGRKRQADCESASVACQSLPSRRHDLSSIPIPPEITSAHNVIVLPLLSKTHRYRHPADGIAMPQPRTVFLGAVRLTVEDSVALVSVNFTSQEKILRGLLVNGLWTQRTPATRLPRIAVFGVGVVEHRQPKPHECGV